MWGNYKWNLFLLRFFYIISSNFPICYNLYPLFLPHFYINLFLFHFLVDYSIKYDTIVKTKDILEGNTFIRILLQWQ